MVSHPVTAWGVAGIVLGLPVVWLIGTAVTVRALRGSSGGGQQATPA